MWYVSKGIAYFDVWVDSADTDIHSSKGAVVNNAAWRLIHALARLHTPENKINIEGFYEGVAYIKTLLRNLK